MWKWLRAKYKYSLILLRELVRTDFKVKYQDSFLGYIWSALKPLFSFIVLYFVFIKVLRVGGDIEHWAVALLVGIVLFQFFTDVTTGTLKSIVNNGNLLRKIKFPRYIIVVSNTVSALITLAINAAVIVGFAAFNGVELSWGVVLIIPFLLELFVFSLGVAFFLSAAYVKFRDIQYIWEVLSQALFYGSAVIFPITMIQHMGHSLGTTFAYIALANPVAQVIQDVRHLAISNDVPSLWTVGNGNIWLYAIPLSVTLVAFVLGAWYFHHKSPDFAENV